MVSVFVTVMPCDACTSGAGFSTSAATAGVANPHAHTRAMTAVTIRRIDTPGTTSQQNKRNYDVCIGLCIVSWIDADNADTSRRRSVAWHAYHRSETTRSAGGSGHRLALSAVGLCSRRGLDRAPARQPEIGRASCRERVASAAVVGAL